MDIYAVSGEFHHERRCFYHERRNFYREKCGKDEKDEKYLSQNGHWSFTERNLDKLTIFNFGMLRYI